MQAANEKRYKALPSEGKIVQYNLHQDTLWYELGELIALYLKELSVVTDNPRSYLVIPTKIPFNSQKPGYREKMIEGINKQADGEVSFYNYQIGSWHSFTWRCKIKLELAGGKERLCFLYGDNIRRRIVFGDVPEDNFTIGEEVFLDEAHNLPLEKIGSDDYADLVAESLMEPLAERTVTIDHLHRYSDNRIRFDLLFEEYKYRCICSRKELRKGEFLPEFTFFFDD